MMNPLVESYNTKITKRIVTSIEYEWPIDFEIRPERKVYHSAVFPMVASKVLPFMFYMKMTAEQIYPARHQTMGLSLYATSTCEISVRISFVFIVRWHGMGESKRVSELRTYNFDGVTEDLGSTLIGGWEELHPYDDNRTFAKPTSVVCYIDIEDELKEALATSFNYKVPPCCLGQDFETFLTTGKNTDITLVSKENSRKIEAHKIILMARSPVFSAMFSNEMSESLSKVVVLDDLDGDVLDDLVQFIYTGSVPNVSTTANRLLPAADRYDLPRLRAICEQEIGDNLSVDNAVYALALADLYQAHQLREHAIKFILHHSPEVFYTDGWRTADEKYKDMVEIALERTLI